MLSVHVQLEKYSGLDPLYVSHLLSFKSIHKRQVELMKQNDIIYLFSPWQRFHKDWKLLGNDLITHVWVDDEHVVWCFADPDKCLKTKKNPNGM